MGNDSPRTIRDTRDSAEDSDDETRQPPNAVASTSKENNKTPPPRDSDTGSPIPVIEYEDTHNEIDLTDENIQDIVSLRKERNAVKGKTRKEVLERLMPTVVLEDINKEKVIKAILNQNRWFNIACTGYGTPVQYSGTKEIDK